MLSGRSKDTESKENKSQPDIYDSFSRFYRKPVQGYVNAYLREAYLAKPSPEPYYRLIQRLEFLTAEDKAFLLEFICRSETKSVARWSPQVKTSSSNHYLLLGLFHNALLDTKKAYAYFKLIAQIAKKEKSPLSVLNIQFAGCIMNTRGYEKFLLPSHPGSLSCFDKGLHYATYALDSLKMPNPSTADKIANANKLRQLAISKYQEGARSGCIKSLMQLGKEYWTDGETEKTLKCFDTIIALGSCPDACLTLLEMLRQDDISDDQLFLKRQKYLDLAISQGALQQFALRLSRELAINCQLITVDDKSGVISFSILYRDLIKQISDSEVYKRMLDFHFCKAQANPIALGHCIMSVVENLLADSAIFKSSEFQLLLNLFNEFVQADPDLFFKMHSKERIAAGMRDFELAVEKQLLTPTTIKIMKIHVLSVLREADVLTQDVDSIVTQYMLPTL